MLPEIFQMPGFGIGITTYGLLQAITFIVTLWVAVRLAAADGLSKIKALYLGICLCPVFLLGAKLLMILAERQQYEGRVSVVSFDLLHSVGAYYGGFVAAVGISPLLTRALKLPWGQMVDVCAPAIALGGVPARLGCFAGGCCWGKPTDSWIGVHFTEKANQATGVPINVPL